MSKIKGCGLAEMINADDLEAMASCGMTPAQVADFYGCSRQNLVNIMKQNPHLKHAFDSGLQKVMIKAVRVLMNKLDKDDTLAAMFFLKCRCGWVEEANRKEREIKDIPQVRIFLPHNDRSPLPDNAIIESGEDSF